MARREIRIGTAGWGIPSAYAAAFPGEGTHLRRYALRMNCVEINSYFYRPHQRKTYERWAASTPKGFRFSVTVPKLLTHDPRLAEPDVGLTRFADEVDGLGDKLGAVLVQLPPSLAFDKAIARKLFDRLARLVSVPIILERRHKSWFAPAVDAWLVKRRIARAAADPAPVAGAFDPCGWRGFTYMRLHGSPRMHYSAYEPPFITGLVTRLKAQRGHVWCVFDNTAGGAALGDATSTMGQLATPRT